MPPMARMLCIVGIARAHRVILVAVVARMAGVRVSILIGVVARMAAAHGVSRLIIVLAVLAVLSMIRVRRGRLRCRRLPCMRMPCMAGLRRVRACLLREREGGGERQRAGERQRMRTQAGVQAQVRTCPRARCVPPRSRWIGSGVHAHASTRTSRIIPASMW